MELIAQLGPGTILAVMAVCFVAEALSGMSGFGAGLIITTAITPIIGRRRSFPRAPF